MHKQNASHNILLILIFAGDSSLVGHPIYPHVIHLFPLYVFDTSRMQASGVWEAIRVKIVYVRKRGMCSRKRGYVFEKEGCVLEKEGVCV